MSKNISFMKSPGVGQKLTSGSLNSIFANQELLKAPSIPNAGEGILSSNLILTELSETNRILGEIQKQLAIDFTNRITEKEKNLSNMRKGIFGKRSKDEEDALEAKKKIDKDSSFLSKTFDAVTKPAKGIFEKLKEFFALLLTGIVTSAAFEWLKDEANRQKLSKFFDWVADHWKWIVGVIAGGVLIGGILNLLGALGGIKTLINLIPKRIPGVGGWCNPVLNCATVNALAFASVLSPFLIADLLLKWPWLKDGLVSDPKPDPKPVNQPIQIPVWATALAKNLSLGYTGVQLLKLLKDVLSFFGAGKAIAMETQLNDLTTDVNNIETASDGVSITSNVAESNVNLQEFQNLTKQVTENTEKAGVLASTIQTIQESAANFREGFNTNVLPVLESMASSVVEHTDPTTTKGQATWGAIATAALFILTSPLHGFGLMKDGGLIEKYAKGGKTKRKKKACCSNCAMGFSAGKMSDGGKLNGPSHAEGGIPIEVEGGEYIVNKSDTTKFLPILEDINYNSGEMWQHFVNATSILNTNLKDQLIINDKISKILTEFNDKLYDLSLAYATDTVMARASQVSDIPSLASSTSSFSGATASLTPVVTVIPKLLTVGKKQRVVRNMSLDIPADSTTIDARSNKGDVSSESVAVKPMASTMGISMTPSPVDSYNVSRMAAVYSLYGIG